MPITQKVMVERNSSMFITEMKLYSSEKKIQELVPSTISVYSGRGFCVFAFD